MNKQTTRALKVAAALLVAMPAAPFPLAAEAAHATQVQAISTVQGQTLTDIDELSTIQQEQLHRALAVGLIQSAPDGHFRPQASLSRQELAALLVQALHLPVLQQQSSFRDVSQSAWSAPAIAAVKQAGLMQGDRDGRFRPYDSVTVQELIALAVRTSQVKPVVAADTKLPQQWSGASVWAEPSLLTASQHQLLSEFSGTLSPKAAVKRADAVSILLSALFPQGRAVTVQTVADKHIQLNGITYEIGQTVTGLLNDRNSAALAGAQLTFEHSGRTITSVRSLQLNAAGHAAAANQPEFSGNMQLDAGNTVIDGDVTVAGDYTSLLNAHIKGKLMISEHVANDFYSAGLQVEGTTIVKGGDDNTVVFNSAVLNDVNVSKQDVHIVLDANSVVSTVNVNTDATIEAGSVLPLVNINNGASDVKLQGNVTNLNVTNNQSTQLTGTSSIAQLNVSGTGSLALGTTGTVQTLQVTNPAALVNVGAAAQVGNVSLANGVASNNVSGITTTTGSPGTTNGPVSSGSSGTSNRTPLVTAAITDIVATEKTNDQVIELNDHFNDPDGDLLVYATSSSKSTVAKTSVSGSKLAVSLLSAGTSTITIAANDGRGKRVNATFKVTVNGNPISTNAADQTLTLEQPGVALTLSDYFTDPEQGTLTYDATVDQPSLVKLTLNNSGQLQLDPLQVGTATVTVTAKDNAITDDGIPGQATITFQVNVLPVPNHKPVATPLLPITVTVRGDDEIVDLGYTFTDPDGDPLQLSAVSNDTGIASTTLSGHQLAVHAVKAGVTQIAITAKDGRGGQTVVDLTVTVLPAPNRSPVVANIPQAATLIIGRAATTVELSTLFSDPDDDVLTYEAVTADVYAVQTSISASTLSITAATAGNTTIKVYARDGRGGEITTNIPVTVLEDATIAFIPKQIVNLNKPPVWFGLLPYLQNLDIDSVSVTADTYDHATATVSGKNARILLTPLQIGDTTVTFDVYDKYGRRNSSSFALQVVKINHAPTVVASISEQMLTPGVTMDRDYDLGQLFSDEDGDTLTYTFTSSNPNVTNASINGNTLTLKAGTINGASDVVITADDGAGGTVQYTLKVHNALLVNAAVITVNLKYGIQAIDYDLSDLFPGQTSFTTYMGTANSTFTGPTALNGTSLSLTSLPVMQWVVGADGRAAVFTVKQDPITTKDMYFSQYVEGSNGRIALLMNTSSATSTTKDYSLTFYKWMKQTNTISSFTLPLLYDGSSQGMNYIVINSTFYDFFDITNAAYFNDEAMMYSPNDYNLTGIVLKRGNTVLDVLGDPTSQTPILPNGGTILRKDGIGYGSNPFHVAYEWNKYPKDTYQFIK
ncbi:S-layer homology domain-containing protein [Paenibacillus campi]|uniref:S-layer homology domain-containing protein n=1 Tax=Paenibacillus campi TaxID=3106031 RepID=UPI002AFFDA74|nr:S-layer homology domain-containing protein [Paenibacillus sp. SGZ-1014]